VSELVLIIDDNEQNAKLTRDVLELAGMRTLSARTASQGLELARAHRPDIVLMDIRLPGLNGGEAALELASDERTADIPVVALSALSVADASVWIGDGGFVGYIEKPIDVLELPRQVRRYCISGRQGGGPPRG
jgi:two-component system, cell cycle response regulator DivK